MRVRASVDRIQRALRGVEPQSYSLDLIPNVARATLIVGSGRSGTTWLAEIVDPHHRQRSMFEPFRADRVDVASAFTPGEYIDPATVDPIRRAAAHQILTGRVRSRWVDQYNHRSVATRRIVKEIRITNLVPWLRVQFPKLPILYLVRHPFGVANSATRLTWDDHLDTLLGHEPLFAVIDVDPDAVRAAATTPFARHVARWAIENTLRLRNPDDPGVLLVSYESLVDDAERQAGRIDRFLGRSPTAVVDDRPSASAWRSDSELGTASDVARSWAGQVDPTDADAGATVLAVFGLDGIIETTDLPVLPKDPHHE